MDGRFVVYSFPRSGRGLLMECLRANALKCIGIDNNRKPPDYDFIFTHDFTGTEEYAGRIQIVLRRDPLASMCSWFEMNVEDGGRPDTWDAFEAAVGNEWVPYWKLFAQKHLMSGKTIVDFNDLYRNQGVAISQLCDMAGVEYNKDKHIEPYPERDITQFKHYRTRQFRDIQRQLEPEYSEVRGNGW